MTQCHIFRKLYIFFTNLWHYYKHHGQSLWSPINFYQTTFHRDADRSIRLNYITA